MAKKVKKLSWFERVMLGMNVCLHKENYQAHKERKLIISNQIKLYKELEKKRDKSPPPPRTGKETEVESPTSSASEKTVSYDAWHANQFPWADFDSAEVSSMPSSSRNTGKAPMVQREIEEDDDDKASGSEYTGNGGDDATEEDSE